MSDRYLIEEREIGNHRIRIYYDPYAECPCVNWDMAARYLFEYSDSNDLHDDCNWKDWFSESHRHNILDALKYMAADVITQKDMIDYLKKGRIPGVRFIYNRSERQWQLQLKCDWGPHKGEWDTWYEIEPSELKRGDFRSEIVYHLEKDDLIQLISNCAKDFIIKEWSSTGYSQGDYCKGIAYMSKKRYDEMVGDTGKPWKEHANDLIDAEVESIGLWMWGDVKGFTLEKKVPFTKVYSEDRADKEDFEWETVDSCWGYFMDTEELIDEVIAEHDLKQIA